MQLDQKKEFVTFFSYLDKLPEQLAIDKLKLFLYANHFGHLAGGFTLGLSPHTEQVLVHRTLCAACINYEQLEKLLEQLDHCATVWQDYLVNSDVHKVLDQYTSSEIHKKETPLFAYQRV